MQELPAGERGGKEAAGWQINITRQQNALNAGMKWFLPHIKNNAAIPACQVAQTLSTFTGPARDVNINGQKLY